MFSAIFWLYVGIFFMVSGLVVYGMLYFRNSSDTINNMIFFFDVGEGIFARIAVYHGIIIAMIATYYLMNYK